VVGQKLNSVPPQPPVSVARPQLAGPSPTVGTGLDPRFRWYFGIKHTPGDQCFPFNYKQHNVLYAAYKCGTRFGVRLSVCSFSD